MVIIIVKKEEMVKSRIKKIQELKSEDLKDVKGGIPFGKSDLIERRGEKETALPGGCTNGNHNSGFDGCKDGDYNSGLL